ncbi:YkgJ family cysteine cluster protein [Candidatus Nitrospira bockiana]
MSDPGLPERITLEITTPAGPVNATLDVPAGFVPISSIVPFLRRVGEDAQALETQHLAETGEHVSCRRGCAACCRMLVPVSPPEAFRLHAWIDGLPEPRRTRLLENVAAAQARLTEAGLLEALRDVAHTERGLTDEELEPLNRAYYALRMPCPFLEDETCAVYEERPAACRELLVTSPAELCQDLINQPIRPVPVPTRVGSVLGLLWSELTKTAPRLIPLPLALEWAEAQRADMAREWKGLALLDQALETLSRLLDYEFAARGKNKTTPSTR